MKFCTNVSGEGLYLRTITSFLKLPALPTLIIMKIITISPPFSCINISYTIANSHVKYGIYKMMCTTLQLDIFNMSTGFFLQVLVILWFYTSQVENWIQPLPLQVAFSFSFQCILQWRVDSKHDLENDIVKENASILSCFPFHPTIQNLNWIYDE